MFSTERGFIKYIEDRMDPYTLNKKGTSTAKKLFCDFSPELLKEATDISFSQYLRYDEDGKPTEASVENCLSKIGGIAFNKIREPVDASVGHIIAIGRRSLSYWNDNKAREIIKTYINALERAGYSNSDIVDDLEREVIPLIRNSANWSSWRNTMTTWVEDVNGWNNNEKIVQENSILPESLYAGTRGYIEKLASQINASYENNLYDCCAVILRRLMEVLLVLAFQNNDVEELILDKEKRYHVHLDSMIKKAETCKELSLSANTKKDMALIKEVGNYAAHKIWYNS